MFSQVIIRGLSFISIILGIDDSLPYEYWAEREMNRTQITKDTDRDSIKPDQVLQKSEHILHHTQQLL